MVDIGITKMSTKGQIVIPQDLREEFKVGEKLIVIKTDDQLIIKKASNLDKQFLEDVEFAKRTSNALERFETNPKSFENIDIKEFLRRTK